MKQVTIDTVRERIAELDCLRGEGVLSLRGEFELACLRMLLDGKPLVGSRYADGIDPYMSNAACLREINEALGMVDITMFSQVATGINDRMQEAQEHNQVRADHAEWSQATFGDVGPIGPLKHLAKEAMEAAAAPGDISEWADMQFLLWDAQRRAGITDEQITQAMIDKLAVNKARQWPEPKDGEPRLHIQADNDTTAQQFEALATSGKSEHLLNAERIAREAKALSDRLNATSAGSGKP